jgi:hypothetical protein
MEGQMSLEALQKAQLGVDTENLGIGGYTNIDFLQYAALPIRVLSPSLTPPQREHRTNANPSLLKIAQSKSVP